MFCNHCGAKLEPAQSFCQGCGKQVLGAVPPAPPAGSGLARHLRLLGIFWLAYSALRLLGSGARVAGIGAVGWLARDWFGGWLDGWGLGGVVPAALTAYGAWSLAIAILGIAAGIGLLERRPWARVPALIAACLALFRPPLGTALGIYTLWALLPDRAVSRLP